MAAAYAGAASGRGRRLALPEPPSALDNPLARVDAAARLRTAVIVLWQYVALLAVPLHLSADYSFNQVPIALAWNDPRFLFAAALLTTLAAALIGSARRAPALLRRGAVRRSFRWP